MAEVSNVATDTKQPPHDNCGGCCYFQFQEQQKDGQGNPLNVGICRRYPPIMLVIPTAPKIQMSGHQALAAVNVQPTFSTVLDVMWCGEFDDGSFEDEPA